MTADWTTPDASDFPRWREPVRAKWAPVFLAPIMGSPERFVVAVVAVSQDTFHLEAANALRRLECLYGKSAQTTIFATLVAFDELRNDLAERGLAALNDPKPIMSGISVGGISDGEASSIEQIAASWMAALSSLYITQEIKLREGGGPDERPMTPAELKSAREQLGMTQRQLAAALGLGTADGGARSVRRWEKGTRRISGPVAIAIRFMLREKSAAEILRSWP